MTTEKTEPLTDLLDSDETTSLEVRLMIELSAEDPLDAVARFTDEVAQRGFGDFAFRVRNTQTDETWIVQGGEFYTTADFLALRAEEEAGSGEGGD